MTRQGPVRVALLATVVDFGGIERVLLTLLEHMDASVEFVPLLFTRPDAKERSFLSSLDALGVSYRTLPLNASRVKYLNPVRNIAATVDILRRDRPHLVHSHGYRANFIALAAGRRLGLPTVSTCHGFIANDQRLRLYNRLDVFLLRYFTGVMAVSDRMKQDLVARGVPPGAVHVITNAVCGTAPTERSRARADVRGRLGVTERDLLLGYVGRLSEEKGLDHLLTALALPGSTGPLVKLLLVGDGPRRSDLEEQIRTLGLGGRVHFAGFQAHTSDWYAAMDGFVLPSLTEGTPMALLEAMMHGLPVIATAVGGVPAVIADGSNGLLVAPADAEQLGEAIRLLGADPHLRKTLGEAARRCVQQRYDVRSWTTKVRELYTSVTHTWRRAA